MPFHLPPLRKRIEEIRPLIDHYAPRLASRVGKPNLGLKEEEWNLWNITAGRATYRSCATVWSGR